VNTIHIRRADPTDAEQLHQLVREAGLPTEGLDAAWLTLVAEDGGQLSGVAALERHGPESAPAFLLRSVVVHQDRRGSGLGRALVRAALDIADAAVERTATVGLLTETADGYFERFGFMPIKRDRMPRSLSASQELAGACSDSARAYLRIDP
jgi:amino-acid N-acetyltransferase